MKTLKNLLYQQLNGGKELNWEKIKRTWAKESKIIIKNSTILKTYLDLVKEGKLKLNSNIEKSLKVRKVRTLSGVAPFAVMMKPFPCPGKCIYCVQEKGMPKSYMSDEPAASRAKQLNFDARNQIISRLQQMENIGHKPEKLEIIVIGGTFSAYPDKYKKSFLKSIYDTCNNAEFLLNNKKGVIPELTESQYRETNSKIKPPKTIQESQKINETAKYRIIGLSVETRPDWITKKEIKLLRVYGVTRVQLGVQAFDDEILKKINRGHDLKAVENATKLLRDTGFKINYHFMPNLPGSNPRKDFEMAKLMFEDERFKPDTLKIYPCIVLPGTSLEKLYKKDLYKSYDDQTLIDLIIKIKKITPQFCRIDRLVRDITKDWTISGTRKTNMRQLVQQEMKRRRLTCNCIRCREIKNNQLLTDIVKYKIQKYKTNNGCEYLLTYETSDNKLYAMLRLQLTTPLSKGDALSVDKAKGYKNVEEMKQCNSVIFPILSNSALIREVHVFGQQLGVSQMSDNNPQHQSYGKKLVAKAEQIAQKNGYKKIAIISGVGVRQYYEKMGYKLKQTYMVKTLE